MNGRVIKAGGSDRDELGRRGTTHPPRRAAAPPSSAASGPEVNFPDGGRRKL